MTRMTLTLQRGEEDPAFSGTEFIEAVRGAIRRCMPSLSDIATVVLYDGEVEMRNGTMQLVLRCDSRVTKSTMEAAALFACRCHHGLRLTSCKAVREE